MIRQFELVDLVKSYDPNADEKALDRAYVFSMKAMCRIKLTYYTITTWIEITL